MADVKKRRIYLLTSVILVLSLAAGICEYFCKYAHYRGNPDNWDSIQIRMGHKYRTDFCH
jgi:hypothetical protein